MNTKALTILILAPLSLLLVSCASKLQGDTYSREDARAVQTVQYGTVEDVRLVVIEGTKTPIGSAAGAVVGGIAGSSVGDGKGAAVATVIGAVAGGLAGSAAEEAITQTQGIELVIRMNNTNKIISLVQQHNPEKPFHVGDRVRLMTVNGETRVSQ
ncbi:MAG: glycine zipper 2TM domain-containing protein [Gammaproteobacteria bacterium]|nr:glycine zipper 2TM domain-containing protein [Gammaproteobacteria bacterium]